MLRQICLLYLKVLDVYKRQDSIREYIDKNFSQKRKEHTEGVVKTAIELARIYGEDEEKAEIAALFHDMRCV